MEVWRGQQALELSRVSEWCFTADHRPWPANPQYVSALFRREVERAGLPAVRSHNLRHTAARFWSLRVFLCLWSRRGWGTRQQP